MEITNTYIKITDQDVLDFYQKNSNLNFLTMNHILINILKSLSSELTDTMNTTINSQILSLVTDMHSNFNTIKTDIIIKLHESKKEYIEDIKTILHSNDLSNHEKINSIVERNNDSLLTKTTLMINDVIPKNQEKTCGLIENSVKTFSSSIIQEINKLSEITNKDDKQIESIVQNIDKQFSKMINTIQQPIFTFIQSSEERTTNSMQGIKDNLSSQQNQQLKLTSELSDFLNKYKNNSSVKGSVSENELYYILQSIMPTDEIVKVASDTATCDIKVNRLDKSKPTILFENKEYNRSLTTEEVKKFERDVQLQKNHGIFISQKSPITYKNNFQIDVINGLIHVYIPNAEYNVDKIKLAIDVIDSLSSKLEFINSTTNDEEYSINKDDLEEIIEEYRTFTSQKLQMIDMIRTISKQLVDKMEDIQLPKLKKLFVKLGNIENDNDFKCTFCNSWSGKNKASLGAHMRNCKFNPKNKDIICDTSESTLQNIVESASAITQEISIEIKQPIETEKAKKNKKINNK